MGSGMVRSASAATAPWWCKFAFGRSGSVKCKVCHAKRCWPARKRCPWVLWGGRLLNRGIQVLLLGALDTFLRGTMGMGMSPSQGLVLAPVPPGQRLGNREKQESSPKYHVAGRSC